jgi:hypothetical protein
MDATCIDHEAALFERLLVTPEAAQAILSIQFSPADKRRAADLCERNTRGLLSSQEKDEMEALAHLGAFLAILHSKARQALKAPPSGDAA